MTYQYGILRTDASSEADEHNSEWLGESTLGIEVINSTLAERCGLGNIDPQHGGEYKSSAIEDALRFPLPPDGTRMVTVRLDRDSLGAMAVLTLRAQEKEEKINKALVTWIGRLDFFGGRNAIKTCPELMIPGYATTAMQVIVTDPFGAWPTVEEKVEEISKILTGELSHEELRTIAVLKKRNLDGFRAEMHGCVAFVRAPRRYDSARNWANQRYEVAVIFDPEYPSTNGDTIPRWSVVRQTDCFDRRGFENKINAEEALARTTKVADLEKLGYSWGGPRNIVSSPHGRETLLTKETILRIARECAESGIVT